MLFTLEALEAGRGDCLILAYGELDSPRFMVIDGGPATIYSNSLKPRLTQLHGRWQREDDNKLDIQLVMVSHIDDDHIRGILDWMNEMENAQDLPYNIMGIWHNSFDDIVGNSAEELRSRLAALSARIAEDGEEREGLQPLSAAVVASVAQGRRLRAQAQSLGIPLNPGFDGLVAAKDGRLTRLRMPGGLQLTVVNPAMAQLRALEKEWEKQLPKLLAGSTAELAAFVDRSVANLSSIVVLAELEGKRMLLTGDARGDHVLEGLERDGLLEDGKLHVGIFKIPHHGSNRNSALELFEKITADHYVISANGEHGNPNAEIFEWIAKARGAEPYSIWLTNREMFDARKAEDVGQAVEKALTQFPSPGRTVAHRREKEAGVLINLGEAFPDLAEPGTAPA
jgi:hypothetical protein